MMPATENATSAPAVWATESSETMLVHAAKAGDMDAFTNALGWMRTAVRKQVTSFGTFLSTLCHEFCHHLDCQRFGFRESWHTRGFYERTAALYHHARGKPCKRLFWVPMPGGRWPIDWQRTNRSARTDATSV